MDQFENIHLYPCNTKFSICANTQYIKKKIKNQYQHLFDANIIHILLYLFDKDRIYFKFDNDNYEEIVINKLLEQASELTLENDRNIINIISTDISFFTNSKIMALWYNIFPEIYEKDYSYQYTFGENNIIHNYTLFIAALEGHNLDTLLYLIKTHKFNFWENIDNMSFKNKELDYIVKILDLEPLQKYTNNISVINNAVNIIKQSQINIQKYIFNELIQLDTYQKEHFIKDILYSTIKKENVKLIKYILKHPKFPHNFITIDLWNSILNKIYDYEENHNEDIYKINHYKRSDIFYTIIDYIIKNDNISISEITNYSIEFIYGLVRLPKAVKTLDLFIDFIDFNKGLIYYNIVNIRDSVLKYGNLETLIYLMGKIPEFIENNIHKSTMEDYLEVSLCNRDIKVSKYLFSINKYEDLTLRFEFLNKKNNGTSSESNKIRKLKLISKYINIYDNLNEETCNVFSFNGIETKKWILKKLFDDNISLDQFDNLPNMFSGIIEEKDIDFIEYFLEKIDKNYNFWLLMPVILKEFTWFHNETNVLLYYCETYSDKLKYKENNLKKNILTKIVSYNQIIGEDLLIVNQNNYVRAINIVIENSNLNINEIPTYIIYNTLKNNNELFKACLICGLKFTNSYMRLCRELSYHIDLFDLKKWIHLYNLIRRLSIRKNLRNKKLHKYQFQSSIIDLETKPMRMENSIVNRGGKDFYYNMDTLDNLYETNNFKYNYPKHILPHQLIKLVKGNITICQKTDGLLAKDIDKENLFPTISNDFEYVKMDGEYIEELDLYLVFGLRSYSKIDNTPLGDYYDLVNEHKYCSETNNYLDSSIPNDIFRKLVLEAKEILDFCKKYQDKKNKWYPKKIWQFRDTSLILPILNMIEKYQISVSKKCMSENDNLDMCNFIKLEEIKTDGIILMKNKNELYKYKPKIFMTADICKESKIYRCYWRNNKWEPVELRTDKKYPNPKELVEQLTYYHNNPWCIEDIIEYQKLMNIKEIYYQHNSIKDIEFENFSKYNKYILNDIIKMNYFNKRYKYLDLGCGFCNNILWKNNDIKVDGIEIDISALERFKDSYNKNLYIGNIAKRWSTKLDNVIKWYYNDKFGLANIMETYNVIIMNFSIQYVFQTDEGFSTFIKELNKHSHQNTKLYISFIVVPEDIYLPRGSYIKKIPSEINYTEEEVRNVIQSWTKTYYTFRHYKPIKEPMLNCENFKGLMKKYGWNYTNEFQYKDTKIKADWKELFQYIKRIEFTKM